MKNNKNEKSHNACYRPFQLSFVGDFRGCFTDGTQFFHFREPSILTFARSIEGSRYTSREFLVYSLLQLILEHVQMSCPHQIERFSVLSVSDVDCSCVYDFKLDFKLEFDLRVCLGDSRYEYITKPATFHVKLIQGKH